MRFLIGTYERRYVVWITEEIAVGMLHIQLWNGFKQIANWGFKMAWRRTFCRGKQIANVIS